MQKRGRLEIIRDILKIIQENRNAMKITPLIRKSNLSSQRFLEYFNDLEKKGFVKRIENKVTITDRGCKYLEKYKNIINFVEEFDL
jgi:predicted transcriptional regulator